MPAVPGGPGPMTSHDTRKPATKEQAGLCELLSSLRVETPEERHAGPPARGYLQNPSIPAPQAQSPAALAQQAQQVQYMQQMSMMYPHGVDPSYGYWPQAQAEADPCPTVP